MSFGLTLVEASRFHGHRGPWLVIGYRAGKRARDVLKPETEHDLVCIVKVPKRIPYTCTVDGVQASAGCTMGKLSISIVDDPSMEFVFRNKVTGEILVLRLKPGVEEIIEKLCRDKGLEAGAEWVSNTPLEDLFIEEKP